MQKILGIFLATFLIYSGACAQTADTSFTQLTGRYTFPEGSVVSAVVVTVDSGKLIMTSEAGVSDLVKQGEDQYSIISFEGTAKFTRDSSTHKINGVVIDARGYHLEGVKASDSNTAAGQPVAMVRKRFLHVLTDGSVHW
jgi:hypothetical protein